VGDTSGASKRHTEKDIFELAPLPAAAKVLSQQYAAEQEEEEGRDEVRATEYDLYLVIHDIIYIIL